MHFHHTNVCVIYSNYKLFPNYTSWSDFFPIFCRDQRHFVVGNPFFSSKLSKVVLKSQNSTGSGNCPGTQKPSHWTDDVIKWKHSFPRCWGGPPVTGGFPSQRPVTRSFDIFFDVCMTKRLSKQSRCRWFEAPWHSLWRHCNALITYFTDACMCNYFKDA